MAGVGTRENVFATRMALTNTKLRLKGAQTGHSLLAKKRDALTTRFRAILRKVDEVRLLDYLSIAIVSKIPNDGYRRNAKWEE
jgi:ATP synthase subunit D